MLSHVLTVLGKNFLAHRLAHAGLLSALILGASVQAYAQSHSVSLEESLQLALKHSSLTKSSLQSIQASQEAAVQAGELPDPMLMVGIENVPTSGDMRFSTTQDSMTMRRIGIEQQWVSADKRNARTQRAERAVELEKSNHLADLAKVREETARAWINLLYAQRILDLYRAIESQWNEEVKTLQAIHRGGRVVASEVTQAQLARSQAQDATLRAHQEVANARLALIRWTVVPVETVAVDSFSIAASRLADMPVEDLERIHPRLIAGKRSVALADSETTVATHDRRPDVSFSVAYSQRPSYDNMVSFGITIPLTVNPSRRQDREVAGKAALATRARLQYEEMLRDVTRDVHILSSTLSNLNSRVTQLKTSQLPYALQQVELATAAYRAGSGSLGEAFAARTSLLEKKLQIEELEKEAALTWTQLEFQVLPPEMLSTMRSAK